MALLKTTTQSEFEEKVLKSDKTVLVDFWAEWCPPCRAMEPTLKKLAEKMDADIDIVKVNVEESPDNAALAGHFGVQGIPNMQVFQNGSVIQELIGMRPEAVLEQELNSVLKKA